MNFPWLAEGAIDAKAFGLLQSAFGPIHDRSSAVDLDRVVEFLSEAQDLSYDDDADLGAANGEEILGVTQPMRRRIRLSKRLKDDPNSGRARFTLAHELGHWVLHRPLFVAQSEELSLFEARPDTDFEFVGLNSGIFPVSHRRRVEPEEWQANRFAVALLIDADVLRREFLSRFGIPVVAMSANGWAGRSNTLRDHARLLSNARSAGSPLREVFGLSTEAMAIALESRGYAVEVSPAL